jgi:SNF2 family DNA or RNA helicase
MESVRDQIDEFSRLDISLVIVDEAHRLKNAKSALTEAFHKFPTPHRYGLTGTAIQNDLNEMWCILNFANPGHVGVQRQW